EYDRVHGTSFVSTGLQLAAAGGVFEGFHGDAYSDVFFAFDFTQVDVLDRIAGLGQFEGAARAVDGGAAHRVAKFFLLGNVAVDGFQTSGKKLGRVVSLYRIDVRRQVGEVFGIRFTE